MSYSIYALIDNETGEIVPYEPELDGQIEEIATIIRAARAAARASPHRMRIQLEGWPPGAGADGDELAKGFFVGSENGL